MIFVLTGPVHSGKTCFLKCLVTQLKLAGLSLSGYLSEPIMADGQNEGYNLCDLNSGRLVPFLRKSGYSSPETDRAGQFHFLPSGLEMARDIIISAGATDLLIIDEVGPAEIRGEGVWPYLHPVLDKTTCLLVIREQLLPDFINLLPLPVMLFKPGEQGEETEYILNMIRVVRLKKLAD